MLTQHILKERYDYDPLTGHFIHKKGPGRPQGKVAGRVASNGYRHIKVHRKLYSAHRCVWLWHYGVWTCRSCMLS